MRDITEYYWFKEVFSKEEIKKIYELASKFPAQEATTFGADEDYRRSEIKWMSFNEDTKWVYEKLIDCMQEANDNTYGFDWDGSTEAIQFTTYEANVEGHYDWHMDIGDVNQNRKISCVMMLNDDYEGGKLMIDGKALDQTYGAGNVVIFPSYMLHKVEPVTKGTRNSLVVWGIGDEPFK